MVIINMSPTYCRPAERVGRVLSFNIRCSPALLLPSLSPFQQHAAHRKPFKLRSTDNLIDDTPQAAIIALGVYADLTAPPSGRPARHVGNTFRPLQVLIHINKYAAAAAAAADADI